MDAEQRDKRDRLIAELTRIADQQSEYNTYGRYRDVERDHIDADDLLVAYINDPDVEDAWNRIDKWYA